MVETADGSGPELVAATMLARTISLEFSRLEVANVESWWLKAMTISLFEFFARNTFYWSILVNLFLGYFRYRALTHSLTDFIRGNPRVTNLSAIIHSRFCCWWSILVISFFFSFFSECRLSWFRWWWFKRAGSKEPFNTNFERVHNNCVRLLLRETDRFPISQTRIPGLIFFAVCFDVDDVLVLVWICFCCNFLFANESKKIVRRVYVLGPNRKRVELDVVHDVLWSHDNM